MFKLNPKNEYCAKCITNSGESIEVIFKSKSIKKVMAAVAEKIYNETKEQPGKSPIKITLWERLHPVGHRIGSPPNSIIIENEIEDI
jgi:hypothetical protein